MARLDKKINKLLTKKAPDLYTIADYYGNEQLSEDIFPVQFKLLQAEQQKDMQKDRKTERKQNIHKEQKTNRKNRRRTERTTDTKRQNKQQN